MVEKLMTPSSPAGLQIVELLTRMFPQIANCEAVEIRVAVGEPIQLTIKSCAAAPDAQSLPDGAAADAVSRTFYLREVVDG